MNSSLNLDQYRRSHDEVEDVNVRCVNTGDQSQIEKNILQTLVYQAY
jgi:hypothetical protein